MDLFFTLSLTLPQIVSVVSFVTAFVSLCIVGVAEYKGDEVPGWAVVGMAGSSAVLALQFVLVLVSPPSFMTNGGYLQVLTVVALLVFVMVVSIRTLLQRRRRRQRQSTN